ncbi:hypothetical protein J3F84DRAFT_384552 [Trichoderma pleuroticola]
MVLTLTWPRFGVRFNDLSDVLMPLSYATFFFFFYSWFFFASRDGRGTNNVARHGQLVLCRGSTIPLFDKSNLKPPLITGQKYLCTAREREIKLAFWQNPCSGICARESAAVRVLTVRE